MERIAETTKRVFKSLAGLDRDEPIGSYTFALYAMLFLMAMALLLLWALGASD